MTQNEMGALREKMLRAMRTAAQRQQDGLQVGGTAYIKDDVPLIDRHELAESGAIFLIEDIRRNIPTPSNGEGSTATLIYARDSRTLEQFKFWAGRYIENQVATDNPNFDEAELLNGTVICAEHPELAKRKGVMPVLLEFQAPPRMAETVAPKKAASNILAKKTAPAPMLDEDEDEELDEDEDEELDEDEDEDEPVPASRKPSKTFQAIKNAGNKARKGTNDGPTAERMRQASRQAQPVKNSGKANGHKQPGTYQDFGVGEFRRRRPPATVATVVARGTDVYFSRKTGKYYTDPKDKTSII